MVAGSESYSGAAVLAGNAAMRSGAGLVTLAVPAAIRSETAARALPEVIVRAFDDGKLDVKADAILIGCGLVASDEANEARFRKIIDERTTPVIVDAGALAFVPTRADKSVGTPLILTPHEGEFLRLLDPQRENHPVDEASPPLLSKEGSLKEDRVAAIREYATANNVILVLKGERVLIGAPDGRVVVNPTGNSGLGKAGNGDTLAGILVGFIAQAAKMDIDIFETVVAAVYIAGMAGDVAEKKYGKRVMTASDVRECLVEVFSELENS
jgi:NAD(P)H-hydrate epimerase